MSFLAIDLISQCINKTKKFLFPINKKLWLKLGLVTLLAGMGSPNPRFNIGDVSDFPSISQAIMENIQWIVLGVSLILLFGIVFAIIRALFNFVLLDSVEKDQCLIKKSLSKNSSLALSYFLFSIVVNMSFLLVAALVGFIGYLAVSATGTTSLIFLIPIAILYILIWAIVGSIIYTLVMPDMCLKRITALKSWKRMHKLFLKEIKEMIIYWVMRFLFGIAAGIIALVVLLVLGLIFAIFATILVVIGVLIALAAKILIIPLIIIGTILGICLFLLLIYATVVVLVPLPVFFTNYRLEFYKGLNKKNKWLKDIK